ncbi:RNAPII degradation factor [Coemansia sp. RSA 2399]|nr:RNAPII degradation factor [Coemansia sp. RSA 2399]
MSTAQSTTHSVSSTSRGGRPSRAGNPRNSSTADEPAEFKALRSKYPSQLKTLNELFPDWTDADLLSAINEADGNLETAITNIAEGFATQWGEVKSRKEKRQAPKHHFEENRPFEKSGYVPRPASFRGGVRGGAARGGRGGYSHATSARARAPPAPKEPSATASGVDSAAGWDIDHLSAEKDTSSSWDAQPADQDSTPKEQKPAVAVANATPAKPAPMSWANVAKRGVRKPSPEPSEPNQLPEAAEDASEVAQPKVPKSASKDAARKPRKFKDEAESEKNDASFAAVTEWPNASGRSAAVDDDMVIIATPVEINGKTKDAGSVPSQPKVSEQDQEVPESHRMVPTEDTPAASVPTNKKPPSNARRLNQDAAVVMPSGNDTLERIGMQFGSLNIGGVEFGSLNAANADRGAAEHVSPAAEPKEAAVPPAPVAAPVAEAVQASVMAAPVSASDSASVAAQGPLTAYLQQQQQQQPAQQAPYSNANVGASAISQMPLPNDYGAAALYGAEAAQRNMMGFYENYGYGQFATNKDNASAPAASAAEQQQSASTSAPAAGINGVSNIGQSGVFPQQMPQAFGMNHGMPYYNPYYYNMMQPGSQFPNPAFGNNPALATAYGQPFMKQGMYPMYPGASPQGIQSTGSQQQPQQQQQPQAMQQPNVAQQVPAQQNHPGVQQQPQGQAGAQQAGVKGAGIGAQSSTSSYGNINSQKTAGNPYGHYGGNIGGFNVYEQDPAALSNSPQQFGLGGIPGIFSAAKAGGKEHSNAKAVPPTGAAPVIGGTTYYSTPQQLGGYSSQANSSHPQGFGHQQQQQYYNPYAPSYGQSQTPHMYQQQQQQQQPPQAGHQQPNKQYWEKQ